MGLAALAYVAAGLLGAVGQLCFKLFGEKLAVPPDSTILFSPALWGAVISYFGVMYLFMAGLRLCGEVSVLYPVYGSTFVWALLLGAFVLDEPVSAVGILGTAMVILGVVLLTSERHPKQEA